MFPEIVALFDADINTEAEKIRQNLEKNPTSPETANQNEQPRPIKHKEYNIAWIDKFACWCIYDENGNKIREPYWGTVSEAQHAIDTKDAL